METGSSRVLVVPRAGGGWQLRETVDGPVLGAASTKQDALDQAALMLERRGGGQVVPLTSDGSVERSFTVGPAGPRPLWYLPPTFLRWALPALFGLQLAFRLLDRNWTPLAIAFAVFFGVMSALGFLAAWRSRVLDRRRLPLHNAD